MEDGKSLLEFSTENVARCSLARGCAKIVWKATGYIF